MSGQTQVEHLPRLAELRAAALDTTYVSLGGRRTSSVHEFYRYPARFSPTLARSAIETFTSVGDLVVDPFCGGGTTAVEAQASGRRSAVADLNSLAIFVTNAKVANYTDDALKRACDFAASVDSLRLARDGDLPLLKEWIESGYTRNVDSSDTWRLRNLIASAVESASQSGDSQSEMLIRCAVLRTGQWALDMRREVPSVEEFRKQLKSNLTSMVTAALARRTAMVDVAGVDQSPSVIHQALPDSHGSLVPSDGDRPRLILTSPPYPGVYVNYHRWKVRGRKESPAPYLIANSLDGQGINHYTMSARNKDSLRKYFEKLESAYSGIAAMMGSETVLIQVVGFSDTSDQLPRYLASMESVGLKEVKFDQLATDDDGRLWREVPSRRWWVAARENAETAPATGRETVLVHRKA